MVNARSEKTARWLTLGGVVGPILFVLAFTVAGLVRPGYSPIHQAVSDLGVGPNAWLLNVPLVLLGPFLIAFGAGFFRLLRPLLSQTWRWLCAVLLSFTGLGFAVAGVFTEAPATVAIHWMVGLPLVVVGTVIGVFLTGLALRRATEWRGWGIYSLIASLATLALVAMMFWAFTPGTPLAPARLGGLMERVLFIESLAWYVTLGWRLFVLTESRLEGRITRVRNRTMNQLSEHPKRPLGRRIQARAMRVVNVPMRVLLRLPFRTPLCGRLMLVSYTGRKTGKAYQQPVSYVQQGNMLLSPGGGTWKWNLRDGQPVHIRLCGRDVLARPERIEDPDEIGRLLEMMMAANPGVRAFVGIPKGPDGRLDREHLETAVRYGFRIVRWHLGEEV